MTVAALDQRNDASLEGHAAGIATRFSAFLIDVLTISLLFAIGGRVFEYIASVLLGDQVDLAEAPVVSTIAFASWAFLYCVYSLAASGQTFGMAILGVRAVRTDGLSLDAGHAVLRVLAFPLSFALFGLGFVLMLVRRDRRALHDIIAGTAVVYAWEARAAHLRFLAKHR